MYFVFDVGDSVLASSCVLDIHLTAWDMLKLLSQAVMIHSIYSVIET